MKTWYLQFTLYDDQSNNDYVLPSSNYFMVEGSVFGDSDDSCFIPVFKSPDQNVWYIGNLVMNYFYLVFDMTPFDEHGKDYIQVGVAPISRSNFIGDAYDDGSIIIGDSSTIEEDKVPIPDVKINVKPGTEIPPVEIVPEIPTEPWTILGWIHLHKI